MFPHISSMRYTSQLQRLRRDGNGHIHHVRTSTCMQPPVRHDLSDHIELSSRCHWAVSPRNVSPTWLSAPRSVIRCSPRNLRLLHRRTPSTAIESITSPCLISAPIIVAFPGCWSRCCQYEPGHPGVASRASQMQFPTSYPPCRGLPEGFPKCGLADSTAEV